jgi:hypothetical protein
LAYNNEAEKRRTGMSEEIVGYIKEIKDTEMFDSGFQKREFTIEAEDGSYKNDYTFELMKDRVSAADGIEIGDEVTVKFNLGRSREYNGRRYTNHHTAWAISSNSKAQESPTQSMPDLPVEDSIPF